MAVLSLTPTFEFARPNPSPKECLRLRLRLTPACAGRHMRSLLLLPFFLCGLPWCAIWGPSRAYQGTTRTPGLGDALCFLSSDYRSLRIQERKGLFRSGTHARRLSEEPPRRPASRTLALGVCTTASIAAGAILALRRELPLLLLRRLRLIDLSQARFRV